MISCHASYFSVTPHLHQQTTIHLADSVVCVCVCVTGAQPCCLMLFLWICPPVTNLSSLPISPPPAGGGQWRRAGDDGVGPDSQRPGGSAGLCPAGELHQWGSLHREPAQALQREPDLCEWLRSVKAILNVQERAWYTSTKIRISSIYYPPLWKLRWHFLNHATTLEFHTLWKCILVKTAEIRITSLVLLHPAVQKALQSMLAYMLQQLA